MLSRDILGPNYEGVNVGAWAKDTQAVASISEDATTRSFLDGRVVGMRPLGDLSNEHNGNALEGFENRFPVW